MAELDVPTGADRAGSDAACREIDVLNPLRDDVRVRQRERVDVPGVSQLARGKADPRVWDLAVAVRQVGLRGRRNCRRG